MVAPARGHRCLCVWVGSGGREAGGPFFSGSRRPHLPRIHVHGIHHPPGRKEGGVVTPLSRAEDRGGAAWAPFPWLGHGSVLQEGVSTVGRLELPRCPSQGGKGP